ncbi:protein SAWADEE HOMEODOMAIN HOMOLOG 1 isoform X2 [Vigna radiata var. radiata]|uniref:Protein SAWADEE HOMEODOMAIN HOMOLOG 1 isoform X2 n=1 Tax=Vigna radiata var. radiata TaxID=3916 RepID=A0A1S3VCD7_VIGRR|nr:protein SAWADEE HOMEODOMAIN HOMOLOG 1 isoform X2 [Vigna radiata var. radiata]
MDTSTLTEQPFLKLSSDEMLELERIYKDMGEKPLDWKLCQEIARRFSSLSNGAGKTSLSGQQVEQWFKNRQRASQNKDSSSPNLVSLSAGLSSSKDISDLAFEARSTKDIAWHDVALFLNYRVMCSGELEVRVRYAGFSKEQDEWVNVKQGVRVRSIPLAPSECQKLQDGNLILCFLERDDYALYCDARIVKIQRRVHDPTECTCTFIIQYLHDQTEEEVSWNRLCIRPTEEESAVHPILAIDPTQSPSPSFSLNPIESLWG